MAGLLVFPAFIIRIGRLQNKTESGEKGEKNGDIGSVLDKTVLLLHITDTVDKNEVKYLNFSIDARSAVPVFKQIKQAIKRFIASGYLVQGDKLMSIRDMASLHGIHPNTIVKVYSQLEIEGYVSSRPGSGYFVKTEGGQVKKEKESFIKDAAREFLTKARQLGYSLEEILPILTALEGTLSSENEKGNEE